jgi:predicted secreted Zn-dependent protease
MPELNEILASFETKRVWKKYYASLVLHEKGHAGIAIDAALAIEQSLLNMPSSSNCRLLSKQANARAEKILQEYRPQHKVYDRETGHGRTQGAYLDL